MCFQGVPEGLKGISLQREGGENSKQREHKSGKSVDLRLTFGIVNDYSGTLDVVQPDSIFPNVLQVPQVRWLSQPHDDGSGTVDVVQTDSLNVPNALQVTGAPGALVSANPLIVPEL